jgi:preprotein translocase subunit SecF
LLYVLQITRECGFFELVNHKLCEHDKRVADRLRKWHESLMAEARRCETIVEVEVGKVKVEMEKEVDKVKAEARRCETNVEVEVGKVKVEMENEADKVKAKIEKQVGKTKAEMDNEIAQYRKEIEIGEIKFQVMKKNYLTMLVGSWILFAFYVFFLRYTSKNQHNRKIRLT